MLNRWKFLYCWKLSSRLIKKSWSLKIFSSTLYLVSAEIYFWTPAPSSSLIFQKWVCIKLGWNDIWVYFPCKSTQAPLKGMQILAKRRRKPRGSLGTKCLWHLRPYPILVYFWSILWPIIDPILVTFGHYSLFLVYFVANYRPHR